MKPKHLILSGWGPYRDKVEVDFTRLRDRGLFLITGATGAGKTTLFDAITYALYGNMSGDVREKNSVRSDFAGADTATFVELAMQHGGKEYRIIRNPEYLRPKKRSSNGSELTKEKENAVLYLPDGNIIQGSSEVNRKIQEILVLDYRQFKQISMIAQGEFARLLAAAPAEKTRIFREIFSTAVYDRFAASLRTRSNELYKRVVECKHRMEEDIHMLRMEEAKENGQLELLTSAESYHYEKILECLAWTLKQHREALQAAEEEYLRYDKEVNIITKQISEGNEINNKLYKLKETVTGLQLLNSQRPDMEKKEEQLKHARAAAGLSGDYIRCENEKKQLAALNEKELEGSREIKRLKEEISRQRALYEKREEIRAVYRYKENYSEGLKVLKSIGILQQEKQEELCKLKKEYLVQENRMEIKKKEYEEADKEYKRAAVGIAAKQLMEGRPCPVCGSLEHPAPAPIAEGIPDEDTLQKLKQLYEKETGRLSALHGKASACLGEVQEKKKQAEEAQRQTDIWKDRLHETEQSLLAVTERMPAKAYEELITGYERQQTLLEEKQKLYVRLLEEIRLQEESLLAAELQFRENCIAKGFSGFEDYQRALRSGGEIEALERELYTYQEKVQAAGSLSKHLKEETGGKTQIDVAALSEEAKVKNRYKNQALENRSKWHHRQIGVAEIRRSLDEKWQSYKQLSEEYGYVRDLDNLASGNNPKRLVFEQYVLAGYFEEILRAANIRLNGMTNGRFELSRLKEVSDGRTKDNLEIQVLDYYTGKYRSVKTLSGGESFKASLSLALGMSDVIQSYSGGIRVETLFIDEGFGSLDSESLDQACHTLMSLVEKDRLIGIISHVPELSEKIDKQIIITKTNVGSRVEVVI